MSTACIRGRWSITQELYGYIPSRRRWPIPPRDSRPCRFHVPRAQTVDTVRFPTRVCQELQFWRTRLLYYVCALSLRLLCHRFTSLVLTRQNLRCHEAPQLMAIACPLVSKQTKNPLYINGAQQKQVRALLLLASLAPGRDGTSGGRGGGSKPPPTRPSKNFCHGSWTEDGFSWGPMPSLLYASR